MAIHNDAMIRVVFVARMVGALLLTGGVLTLTTAVASAIQHPQMPLRWMALGTGLFGGLAAGGTLLVSAWHLDRGKVWAFYTITGIAAAGILWSGAAALSPRPLPVGALLATLALAITCGIAWPQASGIRKRQPYAPMKPIPSTAVIIPPPPAHIPDEQPPPEADAGVQSPYRLS